MYSVTTLNKCSDAGTPISTTAGIIHVVFRTLEMILSCDEINISIITTSDKNLPVQ